MELEILLSELGIQKFHIVAGKKLECCTPYLPEEIIKRASANFTFIEGHCTLHTS